MLRKTVSEIQLEDAVAKRIAMQKAAAAAEPTRKNVPMYQARCDAFSWCVKNMIERRQYEKLALYMQQWWALAFGARPLPQGEVNANDVYQAIRYELLVQGMRKFSVPIPENVRKRHEACGYLFENREKALAMMPNTTARLFEHERDSEFGKVTIHFNSNEEDEMALKKREKARPEAEKKSAKVPMGAPVVKTDAAKSKKKQSATSRMRELLIAGKKTDAELLAQMQKEFPDKTEKQLYSYIIGERAALNRGEYGYKGARIEPVKQGA